MKNLTLSLIALSLYACTPAAETQTETNTDIAVSEKTVSVETPTTDFVWPRSYDSMPEGATLIFSATRDWRHDSGIGGAQGFLGREADTAKADNADGFGLFITEDPRVFSDENLKKFAVIVLNNASGNFLNTQQETAIQNFVESGKGLVAIHASGDSSLASFWPWWEEQLGTEFVSHPADPQFQTADVVVLAEGHPVMAGLGPKFSHEDEWYTFTGPVAGEVVVLAGLDESTYSPVNKVYGVEDLRMGPEPEDHPIIWAKCPGNGRIVYSALGHKAEAYDSEPNKLLMRNMMDWARNGGNTGCP